MILLGNPGKRCPIHAPEFSTRGGKGLQFSHTHSWELWTVPRDLLISRHTKAIAVYGRKSPQTWRCKYSAVRVQLEDWRRDQGSPAKGLGSGYVSGSSARSLTVRPGQEDEPDSSSVGWGGHACPPLVRARGMRVSLGCRECEGDHRCGSPLQLASRCPASSSPSLRVDAGQAAAAAGRDRPALPTCFPSPQAAAPLLPSRLLRGRWIPFTSLPSVPGICVPGGRPSRGQRLDVWPWAPDGRWERGDRQQAWRRGSTKSPSSGEGPFWISRLISTVVWGGEGKTLLGLSQGNKRLRTLPSVSSQDTLQSLTEAQPPVPLFLPRWIIWAASTWALPPPAIKVCS